jgi:hypothetical protein
MLNVVLALVWLSKYLFLFDSASSDYLLQESNIFRVKYNYVEIEVIGAREKYLDTLLWKSIHSHL